jgi:hypothetical protein
VVPSVRLAYLHIVTNHKQADQALAVYPQKQQLIGPALSSNPPWV